MKKLNLLLVLVIGASLLSGCKLSKMIKLAKENELKVVPNPLEVKAGSVPFEMSSKLPPKALPKGTSFTLNTIYKYGDKEINVGSIVFNADDFPKSSSTPSTRTENFSFNYVDGMNPGKLYVEGVAKIVKSGKQKTTDRMEVAKGLILTSLMAQKTGYSTYVDHGYNFNDEFLPTNVDFYFDQGRSNLRTSLSSNGESNKQRRDRLNAFIAAKNATKTVTITGTHSPEGTEAKNSDLSENRAQTIKTYYKKQMDAYDYEDKAKDIQFIIKPVIQDWNNFRMQLGKYDGISSEEKSKYMNILNGSGSFEEKEKSFKRLSSYRKVFKEVYPLLRTAKTEVLTIKPKKSKAEISTLAKGIANGTKNADELTNEELMYAATLTPSLTEKVDIYKAATKKSGSWKAHNNLGAAYIDQALQGDEAKLSDAIAQLEIAANKKENESAVMSNIASVKLLQGNFGEAYTILSKVSGDNEVNAKVNAMKGTIEVMNAQFDKAKKSFNNAKMNDASNINKGLAYLQSNDFGTDINSFGMISNKSDKYAIAQYLTAVSYARQKKSSEMSDALRKAVDADPSLKTKALSDLEFMNYMEAVKQAVK